MEIIWFSSPLLGDQRFRFSTRSIVEQTMVRMPALHWFRVVKIDVASAAPAGGEDLDVVRPPAPPAITGIARRWTGGGQRASKPAAVRSGSRSANPPAAGFRLGPPRRRRGRYGLAARGRRRTAGCPALALAVDRTTTAWLPWRRNRGDERGSGSAAVFRLTFPPRAAAAASASVRMPPPTASGMNSSRATRAIVSASARRADRRCRG